MGLAQRLLFFDLTGAAYSHASSGDPAGRILTPIVLVGLVPRTVSPLAAGVSEFLPFAPAARAFGATLFTAEPLSDALAASGHLLLLAAALGGIALTLFRRLQS